MERLGFFANLAKMPCYTCFRFKANNDFHQPLSSTSNPRPTRQRYAIPRTRYCIPCGVKLNKFKPRQEIKAGGQSQAICSYCYRFNRKPIRSWRGYWSCPKCEAEADLLADFGPWIRIFQALFAIVILALACSGRAVPRSSHLTHGAWRWVFTISLVSVYCWFGKVEMTDRKLKDLCTIVACVISFVVRTKDADGGSGCTFFMPAELGGFLGWTAVVVGLLWEGAHHLYKGGFDRIAIALTVMSAFQT